MALAGLEKLPGTNQIHCGRATLTGGGRTWSKLLFDNPIMEASSVSPLEYLYTLPKAISFKLLLIRNCNCNLYVCYKHQALIFQHLPFLPPRLPASHFRMPLLIKTPRTIVAPRQRCSLPSGQMLMASRLSRMAHSDKYQLL